MEHGVTAGPQVYHVLRLLSESVVAGCFKYTYFFFFFFFTNYSVKITSYTSCLEPDFT